MLSIISNISTYQITLLNYSFRIRFPEKLRVNFSPYLETVAPELYILVNLINVLQQFSKHLFDLGTELLYCQTAASLNLNQLLADQVKHYYSIARPQNQNASNAEHFREQIQNSSTSWFYSSVMPRKYVLCLTSFREQHHSITNIRSQN
ncbi:Hypothetical_protein [Hexamita inflata]|uniref:Hypothetical_protein n=1 Tax=Hexamita inflata TaxID=28002 RepID=A0ABP1HLX2_9EUKA